MPHPYQPLARYGTVGIEFVLSVVLWLFLGHWLDDRYHTQPAFALVGLAIGVTAAFRAIWRVAKLAEREALDAEAEDARVRGGPPREPPSDVPPLH